MMENEEQQSIPPESEKDATLQEMNVPESETDAIPSMEAAPEAASAEAEVTPSEVDASIEQSPSDANIAQPTTDTAQPTADTTQPSDQPIGTSEPAPETSNLVLTPRDNPNAGLTEVEEVDSFGRIVHRTVSRAATLSVITTFNDTTQPKAKILSLDGLLEYTEKDISEKIFEVSLLAETFKDMILLRFARVIMRAFTEAVETRMQIQNLAVVDESAAKEPMEEGEIPKPTKTEEVKNGPVPVKVNRDMYVACQYFDKKNKGHLSQSELLNILLDANLVCSRGEAETIVTQVVDGGKFEYLKLFKSLSSLIVCLVVESLIINDYDTLLVVFSY